MLILTHTELLHTESDILPADPFGKFRFLKILPDGLRRYALELVRTHKRHGNKEATKLIACKKTFREMCRSLYAGIKSMTEDASIISSG
jgi:hypothetical protein